MNAARTTIGSAFRSAAMTSLPRRSTVTRVFQTLAGWPRRRCMLLKAITPFALGAYGGGVVLHSTCAAHGSGDAAHDAAAPGCPLRRYVGVVGGFEDRRGI